MSETKFDKKEKLTIFFFFNPFPDHISKANWATTFTHDFT